MQEWRIGTVDRFERNARRDPDRVEVGLENSLHCKESRRDTLIANRGDRVRSVADGGEMIVLGRDVAVHTEDLAHLKSVKTARLAVQVEAERSDEARHQADAQLAQFGG